MKRFLIPVLAGAAMAGGAWILPASAQTYDQNGTYDRSQGYNYNQGYGQNQNNYRNNNQGGATASGDPWMNENDFDYNRRHWLPGPGDTRQGYGNNYNNNNNYDSNRSQDRYGRNDNGYSNRNYDRDSRYGNNSNRGYDNRNNDDRGFGRSYRPENRYNYDDDDE